jgi:hypothetical protein
MKLLRTAINVAILGGLTMVMPLALGDTPATTAPSISLEQIIRRMDEQDQAMAASLHEYTCLRRYALENRRFHKRAELNVRMTYTAPGHKKFDVLSEQGPSVIRERVLRPMLAAEEEAGRDDVRPRTRIVRANYDFELMGAVVEQGRPAYLLQVTPKTRNKFLIRGRVWIDAKDFGIIRVEAAPAQNPSVFIRNTHVVQESTRFGEVWLPVFSDSNTDSLLFGHTEVTISSWAYKIAGEVVGRAAADH